VNAAWICDACGASFVSTAQVLHWHRLCPCGDGRLHRNAVRRMSVVADEEADRLYAVCTRLVNKLRVSGAEKRALKRQLETTQQKATSIAERALLSDDPEVHRAALKQLALSGKLMRIISGDDYTIVRTG